MESGTILYEFFDDYMKWTIHNNTAQDMSYFIILSKEVKAVKIKDDTIQALPIKGKHDETTWYRGTSALRIEGKGQFRFPFDNDIANQTLEMRLKPDESREIRIYTKTITDDEQRQIDQLTK
jgi:hypothetical protein